MGRIFDDRGNRISPRTAKKGSMHYRYYVSSVLVQGRRSQAGSIARVPACEVEAVVLDALRAAYPVDSDRLVASSRRGQREILPATRTHGDDRGDQGRSSNGADASTALGRQWVDQVLANTSVDQIAAREGCTKQHVVNALPLAFLAPDISGRSSMPACRAASARAASPGPS